MKARYLDQVMRSPSEESAKTMLRWSDALHGKSEHSGNLAAISGDKPLMERLAGDAAVANAVGKAAPWLNLADMKIPFAVIGSNEKVNKAQADQYLTPRLEQSAHMYQQLGLGDPSTAAVIAGSPLLKLLDDTVAMAEKPTFRRADGSLDQNRLSAALRQNVGNYQTSAYARQYGSVTPNTWSELSARIEANLETIGQLVRVTPARTVVNRWSPRESSPSS